VSLYLPHDVFKLTGAPSEDAYQLASALSVAVAERGRLTYAEAEAKASVDRVRASLMGQDTSEWKARRTAEQSAEYQEAALVHAQAKADLEEIKTFLEALRLAMQAVQIRSHELNRADTWPASKPTSADRAAQLKQRLAEGRRPHTQE